MKTLSKTEYETQSHVYKLVDVKLVDISLPKIYFVKAAINIAKSVQHLFHEEHKKVCLKAIETAEKYLRGEATQEECGKVADAANSAFHNAAVNVSAAAARVSAAAAASAAAYDDACVVSAAYYAARAAADVYAAGVYAASTRVTSCDIFRKVIPWNLVCATQIAKCFGKGNDEQFIQNIMKDEKLINYATILLEDENLRKEFEFLMKDYVKE